jgi:hypothetical protein
MPKSFNTRFLNMVPKSVSEHRALVHNHVQHTVDMPIGFSGFRAWTQSPDDEKLEACHCGWSDLKHFRVRGMGSGESMPGTYSTMLAM